MRGKKAEERAAASGGEKPAPAKTEKPESSRRGSGKSPKENRKNPKSLEQPKRWGRPPKENKGQDRRPEAQSPRAEKKRRKRHPKRETGGKSWLLRCRLLPLRRNPRGRMRPPPWRGTDPIYQAERAPSPSRTIHLRSGTMKKCGLWCPASRTRALSSPLSSVPVRMAAMRSCPPPPEGQRACRICGYALYRP